MLRAQKQLLALRGTVALGRVDSGMGVITCIEVDATN